MQQVIFVHDTGEIKSQQRCNQRYQHQDKMLYAFFWVIPRRLNFICRRLGTHCIFHLHRQVAISTYLPMKMEQTGCSETLAYKIQTPGNHPEESIQHSDHGESLKSRIRTNCSKKKIKTKLIRPLVRIL